MNWCVVIPTYNNDKTLEKVIQDVLQITGNIIVVNDGSTDHTANILQRFPNIKTVSYSPNRGKDLHLGKDLKRHCRKDSAMLLRWIQTDSIMPPT